MSLPYLKNQPMARIVGLLTLSSLVVSLLVVAGIVLVGFNHAFQHHLDQTLETRMDEFVGALEEFSRDRVWLLKDIAGYPQLIQGVMQPDTALGSSIDYLETITLHGRPLSLLLFDFEGKLLHQVHKELHPHDPADVHLEPILNGEAESLSWIISPEDGKHGL